MEDEDSDQRRDSLGAEEEAEWEAPSRASGGSTVTRTEGSSQEETIPSACAHDTSEEVGSPSPCQNHDQPSERNQESSSPLSDDEAEKAHSEHEVPHFPETGSPGSDLQGTMSNCALNIVWSFGLNRNTPILNLSDGYREAIMYCCGHVGIMYDYESRSQYVLQGHLNCITCSCISEDRHWLVTGDKGPDATINVWDTYTGIPIQTIFDPNPEGGFVGVALTPNARYMATLSGGTPQVLAVWDWTIEAETPICSADLQPSFGVQNHIIFNSADIQFLITNSETQVLFFQWNDKNIKFYAPSLTDDDFNKAIGRYSMSVFQEESTRAVTATSLGKLVVWDNNMPLTKVVDKQMMADKKAIKLIEASSRGIDVLTTMEKYIVTGDAVGNIHFFDQGMKLVFWMVCQRIGNPFTLHHVDRARRRRVIPLSMPQSPHMIPMRWRGPEVRASMYQKLRVGGITSLSFALDNNYAGLLDKYEPEDETERYPPFPVTNFVVCTSQRSVLKLSNNCTQVEVLLSEYVAAVHALASHPELPHIATGSYSGLLKIWDYSMKQVIASRRFHQANSITVCAYDPKGRYIGLGCTDGSVRIVDSNTLKDETKPFKFARKSITHIAFSHDCQFLATCDAEYTTSLLRAQEDVNAPFVFLGRYRAHYKPIQDLLFGVMLDSDKPRLLSLGADRILVEYDLEKSEEDNIVLACVTRIEQSAVPLCMAWYPPIGLERFLLTANDQYKLKLYNCSTIMCRKTVLGPTFGSPVKKLKILPNTKLDEHYYGAYATEDKVGLIIIPLDGNPQNAMSLVAHPSGVSKLVPSHDGRYLFTAGGTESVIHMWEININALEAQSRLGGQGLVPFYAMLEGGQDGELLAEMEDYFYYCQLRHQRVDCPETRAVSTSMSLTELPLMMRALGFYPSEQEIEDMTNEIKFSRYVETGQYVEELDIGTLIKLYVNHRPAFGLSMDKIKWAFDTLGVPSPAGGSIQRGEFLNLLQEKGEHMTEYELADHLSNLLGYSPNGGRSESDDINPVVAAQTIDANLPLDINADVFTKDVLGLVFPSEIAPPEKETEEKQNSE